MLHVYPLPRVVSQQSRPHPLGTHLILPPAAASAICHHPSIPLLQGHPMYYGQAQQAADWFSQLGYTLPYGMSLADFILDLASGEVATDDRWAAGCELS